jgi:hypothetical protein
MTDTLTQKAVIGRRVLHTRYSDLGKPDAATPGIITELFLNQGGYVKVRLDGQRWTLNVPVMYQGLTYLDQVVPVPELPMGRFHPTADDFGGDWEGVPVCQLGDDDIIILTADPDAARAALAAFCKDMYLDFEFISLEGLEGRWAVFEWQPEDAECPWLMDFAAESDDQAVRIHYLPA